MTGVLLVLLSITIIIIPSKCSDMPCHVITASKTIRPGQIYTIGVHVCSEQEITVSCSIQKGKQLVTEAKLVIYPGGFQTIPLKISKRETKGDYKLVINGILRNSNKAIKHASELEYSPNFLSIVVQTNRPIYKCTQTVRFRVLALETDLYAYDGALEISVLDPDELIMKRWLSVYTNNGVASLHFDLPVLAKEGFWKIRIKAHDQVQDQSIKVVNYFQPYFEVFVNIPPYISINDKELNANIYGMFTTQEYIKGNTTMRLFLKKNNTENKLIWSEKAFIKHNNLEINIPIQEHIKEEKYGGELKLEVEMMDFLFGSTSSGFAISKITPLDINLRFLSKGVIPFKSQFPFPIYISVDYSDGSSLEKETLEKSQIIISLLFIQESSSYTEEIQIYPFNLGNHVTESIIPETDTLETLAEKGVLGMKITPRTGTKEIKIKAYFKTDSTQVEAHVLCKSNSNTGNIKLTTSTYTPVVGEYAIFHVSTDIPIQSFQYLIVSKHDIIVTGEEIINDVQSTITTFGVPMSASMAPGFRIIAFAKINDGLISDSIYVPLNGFNRYEMELLLNDGKDPKGDYVEINVSGDEGAYISVSSIRAIAYKLQAGNELSLSRVTESLMAFEKFERTLNKVKRWSRDGESPQEITYYQSYDYGTNTNHTFELSGLVLFSNLKSNISDENCESTSYFKCYTEGCFNQTQLCDGIQDCNDASDELNCDPKEKNDYKFLVSRISPSQFLFDSEYGDWGWKEIKKNDHEGIEFEPVDVPVIDDDWYFTAFSVSSRLGFSIIESPIIYSSKRIFTAHISGPSECRRGEQVGLRLLLYNHQNHQTLAFVRLVRSPDYKFVQVPEGGIVTSYNAQLIGGDQQILVYIPKKDQARIDIPIAATIEVGEITVTVTASADATLNVLTHTMNILAEGATITRHTSNILDLKNRALVKTYFDIPVEETPIIPYSDSRRYVYGSPQGHVSITGDIIGPTKDIENLNIYSLLGRHEKGTDALAFEFATNILTLHYFRVTNFQLEAKDFKERLKHGTVLYAGIMKRFNPKGYFINWDSGRSSVWLTAWVVRILQSSVYADWENILYIDRKVFTFTLDWLTYMQSPDGSYNEITENSLNRETNNDIALTAHVLISLCKCSQFVDGIVKNNVLKAIKKAVAYLETQRKETDMYSLTIACYALTLAESEVRSNLFNKILNYTLYDRDNNPYWARNPVIGNKIKIENQRPFIQPRLYSEGDSAAVETTAYVILLLLGLEGITPKVDKTVLWLSSMRMSDNGFISKTDSIIALEALTEYANRARLVDVTKLSIMVDSPAEPEFRHVVRIEKKSSIYEPLELNRIWGHVNIMGQGAGLALVQMDLKYGIDVEQLVDKPNINSFKLEIKEYYSDYRNKSSIIIQSCTRWVKNWPERSGAAVLEVDIPSGYKIVESEAEKLAFQSIHPTLKDARILPSKTIWFFEHIPNEVHCFNHTIRRWFPVSNMTLHRQAILYEANQRENYVQVLFNSTPLYTLSICEVCGSYQCPYCPYYNSVDLFKPRLTIYLYTFFYIAMCQLF